MNESNQIKDTPLTTHVRTHTSTSHDSSNHPHPRPVDPPSSSLVHESRLVKSPPSVSSSLCRRLDVARVDRSRRARVSPSSASTASSTASTARTTRRMKIHSSRRRRARDHVDVDREREREIRRSTNPRSTIRALDATARGANRRSGDAIARERCARIRVRRLEANESMRTNERWVRSIDASRRLASASRE